MNMISSLLLLTTLALSMNTSQAEVSLTVSNGATATLRLEDAPADARRYFLQTDAPLRDGLPEGGVLQLEESAEHPRVRSGNLWFDALYSMSMDEAALNSVDTIRDGAYRDGGPIRVKAFQTGEKWLYVWTRDLAYALHLGLSAYDPARALESLRFKASSTKPGLTVGNPFQMVQDTGTGGSYPVSTDRVVWTIGAHETLKYLPLEQRDVVMQELYAYMAGTIEQDRALVFDARDGLYRGEHSFLDWREQTYPQRTAVDVLPIAVSKALSVNVGKFHLLKTASEYAQKLGHTVAAERYAGWASALKDAINAHLYDADAGLYRTYLYSETGIDSIPVSRYDLLGNSLAILLGVADAEQTQAIIERYPTGPHGPPVIAPQMPDVPIYHNQGIWPFVTAYGLRAAREAGNAAVVDAWSRSLMELAAVNLSNMENFDFLSGLAEWREGPRHGPTINSRRQLWSVAGYHSLVQQVVFGLETSLEGIRFVPCVTAAMRRDIFGDTDSVLLENFEYLGTKHSVRLRLPEISQFTSGIAPVGEIQLNGAVIEDGYVHPNRLKTENLWEITLGSPQRADLASERIHRIDTSDHRMVFAPVQPEWSRGRPAVEAVDGRLRLNFAHSEAGDLRFRIFRNGTMVAEDVEATNWTDPDSTDFQETAYRYAVVAYYPESGNESHPTTPARFETAEWRQVVPASKMKTTGGNLVDGGHFENWGESEHRIDVDTFIPQRSGLHSLRVEFMNGSGPINTGITCAVKLLEMKDKVSGEVVLKDHLIMPQSGDWSRRDLSNALLVGLDAGREYAISIYEDPASINMSYLQSNEAYTQWPGGGDLSYNYANIAAIQVDYLDPSPARQ
jgi:hypothetical protein